MKKRTTHTARATGPNVAMDLTIKAPSEPASSINRTRFACLPDGADSALFRIMMAAVVQIHEWRGAKASDRRALRTWARRVQAQRCTGDEFLGAEIILQLCAKPCISGITTPTDTFHE